MNPSLPSTIPEATRRKVTAMDPITQAAFLSEFSRRRKSVILAYLLLGGGLHYAYVGKVWLTLLFRFISSSRRLEEADFFFLSTH